MRTLIAALALLSLAAGPVFAQSYIPPQRGYYGHYQPRPPAAPGEVNIPNPSGGIPGA
ncbi:MAG: hypothetical protein J2P54_18010 [Bradyrhizobiaceae bacterium]|nr:hypothetical protein [Bradyrhizobiaceae bacterium]